MQLRLKKPKFWFYEVLDFILTSRHCCHLSWFITCCLRNKSMENRKWWILSQFFFGKSTQNLGVEDYNDLNSVVYLNHFWYWTLLIEHQKMQVQPTSNIWSHSSFFFFSKWLSIQSINLRYKMKGVHSHWSLKFFTKLLLKHFWNWSMSVILVITTHWITQRITSLFLLDLNIQSIL